MKSLRVLALEQDRHSLSLVRAMLHMTGLERVKGTLDVNRAFSGLLEDQYDVAVLRADGDRFDGLEMLKTLRLFRRRAMPVVLVFNGRIQSGLRDLAGMSKVAAVLRPMSARQLTDRIIAVSRPTISFEHYPPTDADIYAL